VLGCADPLPLPTPPAGPAALAHLRLCGVASLRDRQAVANCVSRAVREGLLDFSSRAAAGASAADPHALLVNVLALLTAVTDPFLDAPQQDSAAGAEQASTMSEGWLLAASRICSCDGGRLPHKQQVSPALTWAAGAEAAGADAPPQLVWRLSRPDLGMAAGMLAAADRDEASALHGADGRHGHKWGLLKGRVPKPSRY
jgi:hypothetical protein